MGYKQKHPYLAQIWYIIRDLLRRWQRQRDPQEQTAHAYLVSILRE